MGRSVHASLLEEERRKEKNPGGDGVIERRLQPVALSVKPVLISATASSFRVSKGRD